MNLLHRLHRLAIAISSCRVFPAVLGVLALGVAASQGFERIDITAYKPPQGKGSTWVYSRSDKAGGPGSGATRIVVEDEFFPIKLYQGLGEISSKFVSVRTSEVRGRLVKGKFVPLGGKDAIKSFLYFRPGGGYHFYGLDEVIAGTDDKVGLKLRVTDGFNVPLKSVLGQGVRQVRTVFGNGKLLGDGFFRATVLGIESVKVPAGSFDDCLHVRLQLGQGPDADIGEEWWARGVGLVKWVGISGTSKGVTEKLVSMDLKAPFKAAELTVSGPSLIYDEENLYRLEFPAAVWNGPLVDSTFTLTNAGAETLKDLSLKFSGNGFFMMDPFKTRNLKGGESLTIQVTLGAPMPLTIAYASIILGSSDPDHEPITIRMQYDSF